MIFIDTEETLNYYKSLKPIKKWKRTKVSCNCTNVKSTINGKKYFNLGELTFNDLNDNRNEWLNIKTLEEVGIL